MTHQDLVCIEFHSKPITLFAPKFANLKFVLNYLFQWFFTPFSYQLHSIIFQLYRYTQVPFIPSLIKTIKKNFACVFPISYIPIFIVKTILSQNSSVFYHLLS
jgi:hypothetical protein